MKADTFNSLSAYVSPPVGLIGSSKVGLIPQPPFLGWCIVNPRKMKEANYPNLQIIPWL